MHITKFVNFLVLLLYLSGLGYMIGAYAGYMMGSWQWALRVSLIVLAICLVLFLLLFLLVLQIHGVIIMIFVDHIS